MQVNLENRINDEVSVRKLSDLHGSVCSAGEESVILVDKDLEIERIIFLHPSKF